MLFQRFHYEPLAQAAYLLADDGDAAIVDPRRDVTELLMFAEQRGLRIRWALATHVHADFVTGLREVAAATGAQIGLGERFDGPFGCERLADRSEMRIGGAVLQVLATPGHTPESVCFLVRPPDHHDLPLRLLTGDTLFVGDVGRPDLVAAAGRTPRAMARELFASLHERIARLPDDTEVWPAHGAGSACGTAIACASSSTLGAERLGNWALDEPDAERFCDRLLGALRPPPNWFAHTAALNRVGPRLLAGLALPPELQADAVVKASAAGALVLDVRSHHRHAQGHWPGSLHLGGDGMTFEAWAAVLLPTTAQVVLHAEDPVQATFAWRRLLGIGVEAVTCWTTTLPAIPRSHRQFAAVDLFTEPPGSWQVIDVRQASEYEAGHVPGAVNAELGPDLAASAALQHLDRQRPTAVLCENGYRSSAATQQLLAAGFQTLCNVHDGTAGWRQNHLPLERGRATATS